MKFPRLRRNKRERPDPGRLMPPEGVPLNLPIAALGTRLAAQITDVVLTGLGAVALVLLLLALGATSPQTLMAVAALMFFVIRIPYYVMTELAWNGQTLGKRLMKIKVVSHDGGSLTTHSLVLRNLMKEAEIFLPGTLLLTLNTESPVASLIALAWVIGVLLVPLLNRYRMRLGDMMAGTHVIALPVPVLLRDLAREAPDPAAPGEGFNFLPHQLDHYGAYELQTLESILRVESRALAASARKNRDETLQAIVEKIRTKIGYAAPVPPHDRRDFLKAFYAAQRKHLEQRQLFGDRRADKHHAATETTDQ